MEPGTWQTEQQLKPWRWDVLGNLWLEHNEVGEAEDETREVVRCQVRGSCRPWQHFGFYSKCNGKQLEVSRLGCEGSIEVAKKWPHLF
jgi:hypothetical protein